MKNQTEDPDILASDLPSVKTLLANITVALKTVKTNVDAIELKRKECQFQTSKGLSLLELKNQYFMSYLANLTYITLRKLSGKKLEGDPSIERAVECRAVLERIKPLESKLKYQIDRYVKAASSEVQNDKDSTRLTGDLDNIVSSSDDEEGDTEPIRSRRGEDRIYRAPKISQVHYPGEEETEDKKKERMRKHTLSSSMLQEALQEHTEDPEVVFNNDVHKQNSIRKRKKIEKYEEEYMTRVTLSKKEKAAMKQITTIGTLGSEILSCSNLDVLEDNFKPSAKKHKGQGTIKNKKAKGKKRKKRF
ncbi:neuroguidin-like [Oratosquilla oratoria]|uniref:neuroguidin-like n=1 Tax=Oratosquilla oratoria TaxID=337810 RepID=UPI003F76DB78